jgi:hypothetical protein
MLSSLQVTALSVTHANWCKCTCADQQFGLSKCTGPSRHTGNSKPGQVPAAMHVFMTQIELISPVQGCAWSLCWSPVCFGCQAAPNTGCPAMDCDCCPVHGKACPACCPAAVATLNSLGVQLWTVTDVPVGGQPLQEHVCSL